MNIALALFILWLSPIPDVISVWVIRRKQHLEVNYNPGRRIFVKAVDVENENREICSNCVFCLVCMDSSGYGYDPDGSCSDFMSVEPVFIGGAKDAGKD